MPAKKIIVALLIIVVAVGGFVAGLFLLRERQELREEASVPTGQAEVSITPESGDYVVGETINASIYFNPANIAISGVAVRLTYPFSGTTPEVSVAAIEVNSALLSSGDWTCPIQNSSLSGGNVVVDISCTNTSAFGFSANTATLLANLNLRVDRAPSVSPLVIRFDPAESIITRKTNNEDILLIPTSTGSYTVAGATNQVTGSPTPTTRVTGSPSPTTRLTATPTGALTLTPTATTTKGGLPDAGVSYPTFIGAGLGILVIIGAALLAL
ncbi:MAG: Mucin related 82C [Candidatus Woesebacteria bacterium GW2011_GWB1_39_10b]|uniref:Mucin related 82C n=2 Tax=Candidatus Woeseibacteriota TaxID=1752722 RepID=A0A0G0NLH7_9BACT|nr:MAG: protein of unknown function with transmembrane region [Microgenomates group bacterium GW2011_GWC1_38_12]KKQ93479.1 MAG: Mucin related 82C [Candidatus Woesebacteria bacterium GW2011_GWB1_39_10b]KKR13641.1 MAG: Mucin related 82C [Candidatus Woesebacteria bacterium GW2011_GWA1_39_21b]